MIAASLRYGRCAVNVNGWRRLFGAATRSVLVVLVVLQSETVSRAGTAEIVTSRRPRRKPKVTEPGTSANSVSSLPRPTPSPGWKWVPRWRTMISPALTTWPPKRLTPRYCAFESRPLRVEDAPFLCAMSEPLLDSGDLDAGQVGAETLALLVTGLVLELLDDDLRAAKVSDDLGRHGHLRERLGVVRDGVTVDEQHRRELDVAIFVGLDAVENDNRADLDLLLPPTGAHDCVNHECS